MAFITLPIKIDFKTWASQVIIDLPFFEIPFPGEEADWEGWVYSLISASPGLDIPNPKYLNYKTSEHWREWAEHYVVTISNIL